MLSIQRILVPVDFSRGALLALETALTLAEPFGAQVHVLNVWQPPPYIVPEMMVSVPGSGEAQTFDVYMHRRTLREVEDFIAPVRSKTSVSIVTDVLSGTPREVILRYAAKNPIDMIIMGTHGRGGLMHLLLGSVAEHIVRSQPCPVMTVRYSEED